MKIIERFSATEKVLFGIFFIAAAITCLMMASSVNEYFKTEVPAHGGELREGVVGLPRTINPVLALSDTDRDLTGLVYSGLMKYDGQNISSDLAQSYTVSSDGLVYTFKLRPDIYFQDNVPVTADDIEFTIQKIQDPGIKSPRRADWANVTVNKISQNEIQFILKQAYSPFITNTTIGILPKHVWNRISDDQFVFSEKNLQAVGSGPYKVSSISKDENGIPTNIKLNTWDKFGKEIPYISGLSFNFYSDFDQALNALKKNDIDSLGSVTPTEASKLNLEQDQAYKILNSPMPRIFSLFFNQNQVAIFKEKVVRQALDISVDRNAIINNVLSGYGTELDGPLPTMAATSFSTSSRIATSTDLSKNILAAQNLLEKNGWAKDNEGIYVKKATKNSTTTLSFSIYTGDSEDLRQTAQILKDSWTKLGANVDVKVFSGNDLYQNVIRNRKYDTLLFGEQIGKDRDLYAFWHSSQRNAPGLNVAMYTNSKTDKILEDIRSTNDENKLNEYYKQLDAIIKEDLPAIFLYSPDFTYVVPKQLKGIMLSGVTSASDRFNTIEKWYLKTDNVWKFFTN